MGVLQAFIWCSLIPSVMFITALPGVQVGVLQAHEQEARIEKALSSVHEQQVGFDSIRSD